MEAITSHKPSTAETTTKPAGTKKPRKLTEKRKVQNRLAQRKYRERQARLLEELRLEVTSREQGHSSDSTVDHQVPSPLDVSLISIENIASTSDSTATIEFGGNFHHDIGSRREHSILYVGFDDLQENVQQQYESPASTTTLSPHSSPTTVGQEENEILISNALALSSDHTLAEILSAGIEALAQKSSPASQALPSSLPPLPLPASTNFAITQRLIPFIPPPQPSLQANALTTPLSSTINALVHNALALGYNLPVIMLPDALSTFHNPFALRPSNASTLLLPTTRLPSDPYPSNLHPTYAQTLIPHNPFLDLIPFPAMRSLALLYTSQDPPLIDAYEFKTDTVVNEGLVCWGGDEGQRRRAGGLQPWDTRAWTVKPWFLKKYWMLVGGEKERIAVVSEEEGMDERVQNGVVATSCYEG